MKTLPYLIARNCKLFFKDKGVFFASLIAPLILLFLFIAFLGDVYRDSLTSVIQGAELSEQLVEGFAGGWLMSSLIAVCAVSISFTANMIMVNDRVTGCYSDLTIAPVSRAALALAYYISTVLVTLAICYLAVAVGFIYISAVGWYLSAADVFLILLDTLLLVLFGTALSSIVCHFLKSQGGITAVEAIISSAYGFLCGAYMPISSLATGLMYAISFLPGTYGTVLLHSHFMGGSIEAMGSEGIPAEYQKDLRDGFDCNFYFFDHAVPEWASYLILGLTVVLLVGIYVLLCAYKSKKVKKVKLEDKKDKGER